MNGPLAAADPGFSRGDANTKGWGDVNILFGQSSQKKKERKLNRGCQKFYYVDPSLFRVLRQNDYSTDPYSSLSLLFSRIISVSAMSTNVGAALPVGVAGGDMSPIEYTTVPSFTLPVAPLVSPQHTPTPCLHKNNRET